MQADRLAGGTGGGGHGGDAFPNLLQAVFEQDVQGLAQATNQQVGRRKRGVVLLAALAGFDQVQVVGVLALVGVDHLPGPVVDRDEAQPGRDHQRLLRR